MPKLNIEQKRINNLPDWTDVQYFIPTADDWPALVSGKEETQIFIAAVINFLKDCAARKVEFNVLHIQQHDSTFSIEPCPKPLPIRVYYRWFNKKTQIVKKTDQAVRFLFGKTTCLFLTKKCWKQFIEKSQLLMATTGESKIFKSFSKIGGIGLVSNRKALMSHDHEVNITNHSDLIAYIKNHDDAWYLTGAEEGGSCAPHTNYNGRYTSDPLTFAYGISGASGCAHAKPDATGIRGAVAFWKWLCFPYPSLSNFRTIGYHHLSTMEGSISLYNHFYPITRLSQVWGIVEACQSSQWFASCISGSKLTEKQEHQYSRGHIRRIADAYYLLNGKAHPYYASYQLDFVDMKRTRKDEVTPRKETSDENPEPKQSNSKTYDYDPRSENDTNRFVL